MNDDELSLILRDQLHRRIDPPAAAPERVYEQLLELRHMQPVRESGARPTRVLRNVFGLAAALAIGALVAGAFLVLSPSRPGSGVGAPANGIEAFGRIDSKTAWAESGSDLYITRDGGETWSHGTVPGGKSPMEITAAQPSVLSGPTFPLGPNHYYPEFIDASHGWLLSWTTSGSPSAPDYAMTMWRTSDGGRTWSSASVPGTYRGFGVSQFVDASHGWIEIYRMDVDASVRMPSDETSILATADGGATWTPIAKVAALAFPDFVSRTEAWGYAAASSGTSLDSIVHSTDGGRTWSTSRMPIPDDRRAVGWSAQVVVSGETVTIRLPSVNKSSPADHGSSGSLAILTMSSSDGGRTWKLDANRPVPVSGSVASGGMSFLLRLPSDQPIVVVDSVSQSPSEPVGFQATFDGGATWTRYGTRGLPGTGGTTMFEWASSDDVWILTSSGTGFDPPGKLYATTDAGKTWRPLLVS